MGMGCCSGLGRLPKAGILQSIKCQQQRRTFSSRRLNFIVVCGLWMGLNYKKKTINRFACSLRPGVFYCLSGIALGFWLVTNRPAVFPWERGGLYSLNGSRLALRKLGCCPKNTLNACQVCPPHLYTMQLSRAPWQLPSIGSTIFIYANWTNKYNLRVFAAIVSIIQTHYKASTQTRLVISEKANCKQL